MNIKQYLLMGILAISCPTAFATPPQDVKKAQQQKTGTQGQRPVRIQTSARPEQTAVYKPAGSKQAATVQPAATKGKKGKEKKAVSATNSSPKNATKKISKVPEANRYIAIKNNLAYQGVAVSNLAVEVQCSEHLSVELPLIWSFWDMEQEHGIRTFALQPEARWWTGNEVGRGHFFGVHAHVAWFNVKWNDNRYQSNSRPLLGAGISYGYKLPFGEHWGAEFSLGAGYANMKYDTYYNIDNGAKIDTRIRNYWGITRLGLSLVYRF